MEAGDFLLLRWLPLCAAEECAHVLLQAVRLDELVRQSEGARRMSRGGAHTSGEPRARCLGRGQERGRVIIRFLPARLAGEQVCIAVAALDNVRFEHSSFHRRVHGDRFVMEVRHAARRHHQKTQGSPTARSSGSSAWVLRYLGEERQARGWPLHEHAPITMSQAFVAFFSVSWPP